VPPSSPNVQRTLKPAGRSRWPQNARASVHDALALRPIPVMLISGHKAVSRGEIPEAWTFWRDDKPCGVAVGRQKGIPLSPLRLATDQVRIWHSTIMKKSPAPYCAPCITIYQNTAGRAIIRFYHCEPFPTRSILCHRLTEHGLTPVNNAHNASFRRALFWRQIARNGTVLPKIPNPCTSRSSASAIRLIGIYHDDLRKIQ
jgi:hypothetical protein